MSGYLHDFRLTGIREIDAIINAITDAGDYYHHTEMWNEREGEPGGKSCVDRIQDAIDKAAAALRADAAGWVSFDDPPKTDGQYHVYRFATNGTYKGRPFQWIAMWENGTWLDYDPMADDYIHECEPTHWRPLPPAPRETP